GRAATRRDQRRRRRWRSSRSPSSPARGPPRPHRADRARPRCRAPRPSPNGAREAASPSRSPSIVGALAAPRASTSWPGPQMASALPRVPAGPLLLAVAVPLVFLHVRYQPDLGFSAGGTNVDVTLSDLAVLAVALGGLATIAAAGLAPLRRGLPVWLAGAALLIVVLVSLAYPGLRGEPYDWHARLVSALKFCEYAALALAAPLLVRRKRDMQVVAVALVSWSTVATTIGLLQYVGLVHQ